MFRGLCLLILCCGLPLLSVAATITVTHSGSGTAGCTLRNAINAANTNAAVGSCTAGNEGGTDFIELSLNVQLTAALPPVTTSIQINGNGFTLSRCGASAKFGLLRVNGGGDLRLNGDLGNGNYGLTLQCGETTAGGGLYVANESRATGRFVRFIDHIATTRGGAVYVEGDLEDAGVSGQLTLTDSLFANNQAVGDGGAIYNLGRITLERVNFSSGCVLGDAECTWPTQKASGNTSGSGGGAIYNASGEVTLISSVVAHNSASIGGGLANVGNAQMTLTNTLVTANGNRNSPPNDNAIAGGGIHNASRLVLRNSVIAGNLAAFGGGIDNIGENNGGLSLFSTTVLGNCALNRGGAIRNQDRGRTELANSVVWANADGSVNTASASVLNQGVLVRQSSLVQYFDNQGIGNLDGAAFAGVYDYPQFLTPPAQPICGTPKTHLASDGYPKPTSPLIDRGDNARALEADLSVDYLNAARIQNDVIDIGPFETPVRPVVLGLATRALVGTGDRVLIGGVIVAGDGTKPLSFVARGPSLVAQGISNFLPNPQLVVYPLGSSTPLAINDDWTTGPNAEALRSRNLAPSEAGVVLNLGAGAYTVVVSDTAGRPGVGLVEVYDERPDQRRPRLTALSTRGFVGPNSGEELIGGIAMTGVGQNSVLWMGKGPSLTVAGVAGALANPTIALNGGGLSLANDDWTTNTPAANEYIRRVQGSLQPTESAILRAAAFGEAMTAGLYTLVVSSAPPNGEGVAIVELYEVP